MGREWTGSIKVALTCENTMFCAPWNKLRIREKKKIGRETDRRHLLAKSRCFAQFGIRISSMQSDISTTEFGDHRM